MLLLFMRVATIQKQVLYTLHETCLCGCCCNEKSLLVLCLAVR
jgi:hypothetical protein